MAENVVNTTVENGALYVQSNGSAAPFVVSVEDGVCSVAVLATNGKPITTLNIIDKETGNIIPVNISTCAEAVVCNAGIPVQIHLQDLHNHANNKDEHLTAEEKQSFETQTGAQAKATAAKNEAVVAASLLVEKAKNDAAADATAKADAARSAAYRYTEKFAQYQEAHELDINNPHGVTAAQVGLGNVPNKSTNDTQPTYSEATSLTPLTSGERMAVAFGKIAKAITSLISHLGDKANPHKVTASQAGALPTTGGKMIGNLNMGGGHITLTRGKNYGTEDEIPADLPEGGLFFKVVS